MFVVVTSKAFVSSAPYAPCISISSSGFGSNNQHWGGGFNLSLMTHRDMARPARFVYEPC